MEPVCLKQDLRRSQGVRGRSWRVLDVLEAGEDISGEKYWIDIPGRPKNLKDRWLQVFDQDDPFLPRRRGGESRAEVAKMQLLALGVTVSIAPGRIVHRIELAGALRQPWHGEERREWTETRITLLAESDKFCVCLQNVSFHFWS